MILWRAARCLRPCDRLPSFLSVMPGHLIITVNNTSNSPYFSYFSKSSLRLFTAFIPFRLCLISFISLAVKVLLKYTFSSPDFFPLTYPLQQIGQFSHFVSQFSYFLAISSLQIGNSFANHVGSALFFLLSVRKT